MPANIRIAIVDDHEIVRKSISDALMYANGFNMVFLAENGVELLFELERNPVDVIILDLQMPIMSGEEALVLVRERYPETKIIVLSSYDNRPIMADAFQKGSNAYLSKDCGIEDLIDAIHGVMEKGYYFTENFQQELVDSFTQPNNNSYPFTNQILSERELDIIKLICEEKCSREISEKLNISERTVENHRYHISKKIGTSNGIGMLVYALQNGIAKITADGKIEFD